MKKDKPKLITEPRIVSRQAVLDALTVKACIICGEVKSYSELNNSTGARIYIITCACNKSVVSAATRLEANILWDKLRDANLLMHGALKLSVNTCILCKTAGVHAEYDMKTGLSFHITCKCGRGAMSKNWITACKRWNKKADDMEQAKEYADALKACSLGKDDL